MQKKLLNAEKQKLNEEAISLSIRSEEKISYDSKFPLVINRRSKIKSIELKEENYEYGEREVRITFKNNRGSAMKVPYSIDIITELDLNEIEDRIIQMKYEEELEDLSE